MHKEFKEDISKQKLTDLFFEVIRKDMKVIIYNLQNFGNGLRVFFIKHSSHSWEEEFIVKHNGHFFMFRRESFEPTINKVISMQNIFGVMDIGFIINNINHRVEEFLILKHIIRGFSESVWVIRHLSFDEFYHKRFNDSRIAFDVCPEDMLLYDHSFLYVFYPFLNKLTVGNPSTPHSSLPTIIL